MALLFMDSFDHYVTADRLAKWNSDTGWGYAVVAAAGRNSSAAMRTQPSGNGNSFLMKTLSPADATCIMGVAFKTSIIVNQVVGILSIGDASTPQVQLQFNTDGKLSVVRGSTSGGVVLGTTSLALTTGTYYYIEWKVKIDPSVGTVDVRVNGVSWLSLTGQNTRNTGSTLWTTATLGTLNGQGLGFTVPTFDYDDLYVMDGSGAAPWNNFLGDVRVDPRVPTAAGATTGWTPSAGSNWQNVDDAAPNADTDFNAAAAAALTDTFVVQDAPVVGATVFGVQHCISVRKTDAGACTVAPVIRHSAVDNVGSDISPSTTYGYGLAINQTNPGTAAQWTEANFNAAEFGYRRTT